jgi:hypothetical protein
VHYALANVMATECVVVDEPLNERSIDEWYAVLFGRCYLRQGQATKVIEKPAG